MTLQDILKAQGLNDEQIKAVADQMKANKIFTAGEENLDIRYGKLKTEFDNLTTQHGEATTLIEQLKTAAKGNEGMQNKIAGYEQQIAQLQEENMQTKLESAVKVALLEAKATDIDYMTFKLKEKGELALTDDGKIKGIDDMIAGLKTQFPTHFENGTGGTIIDSPALPNRDGGETGITKEQFDKMGYNSKVKLKAENPELYAEMTNK